MSKAKELKAWQKDGEEHLRYNAFDTVVTGRVYKGIMRDLAQADEVTHKLVDIHHQVSGIVAEMYQTGIYVRQDWRAFMKHCLEQSVEEKRAFLRHLVGQEDFPCTPNSMRALLFKRHRKDGIKCWDLPDPLDKKQYTDETKETIAVDENSLLLLLVSGQCPPELIPIIDAWWDLGTETKRLGYIGSDLFDQAVGPDGRLRPGWNSCGTDTMRFSCRAPNVMNMETILRHVLGPPPGRVIVHADKSQLELRVMAVVAADNVLQDALNTGDVYSFNVIDWYRDQLPADVTTEMVKKKFGGLRKGAKITHLGSQYGAGTKTIYGQSLRQDRRFTFSATQILHKKWKKTYYRTVAYWSEEMARVLQCGYSEGRIIGGRRHYPRPPDLSEVANYPVQRTAAEMMNLELIELHKRLKQEVPDAKIIIQLHDAIDVECAEKDEAKVTDVVMEVMNREWEFCGVTRPFPVELKVATYEDTWAAV